MKRLRWSIFIVVIALVAAACSSSSTDTTEAGGESAETTTTSAESGETTTTSGEGETTTTESMAEASEVTLWHTFNEAETPTLDGLVAACSEATGHTVTVELVPFAEAQNKFKTAAQAGEAPDIMRAEIAWIAEFADLGYLAPLTGMVSAEDAADYLEAPSAYGKYAGELWAVPQATDAPAVYYNKALLEEHSIDVPTTMDELKAAGIAFGDATGTPGIGTIKGGYWTQIFIWAFGGELMNDDGSEIFVNSPESVAGLDFYVSMQTDGAIQESLDFANEYSNVQEAFKAGEIAFNINGPWQSADLLAGEAFADDAANLGIIPAPPGPGGQGSPVGGHSWVVSADALDAGLDTASYEVISCLNSTDSQVEWAVNNNILPTRASAYERPEVQENAVIAAFGEVMAVAHARPVIPAGGAIYASFDPNVQAAFQGTLTGQEALDNVATAWETDLGLGSGS